MANNPINSIFNNVDKFLDILNIGRLIFYTAAGFLAIYPIYMILNLLTLSEDKPGNFFMSFAKVSQSINEHSFILVYASLVAGFLIASVGYTVIIDRLDKSVKDELMNFEPSEDGFSYNYKSLRNNEEEDYKAWLISESFRYVEIVIYVPMGFIIGLIFLAGYTVIYPFYMGIERLSMTDIGNVVGFLLFISTVISLLLFYVWPNFWRPSVAKKTLRTYQVSKKSLIKRLQDDSNRENKNDPSQK